MRLPRLIPALALAVGLFVPSHALGATFTPTTTADANNGACTPALCTLRDAVVAAGAADGNEVAIPAGTYNVSIGEIEPENATTIRGAGAGATTIDAHGTGRVFTVQDDDIVTFQDLTITGGAAGPTSTLVAGDGGAILNQADGIVLRRVALIGNTATFSGGGYAAPFEGSGGQVTTIEDSLIAGNTVTGGVLNGQGGGLSLFGDATITNSTISGNSVANAGANQGGGIVAATSPLDLGTNALTLLNTTIAGNSVNGPGPNVGGGIVGNSLGVTPVLTDLRAKNTIVAGNTVDGAVQDCGLVMASQTSHNLSGDTSCGFTDGGSRQSANPLLGALADNGGPTNTRAPGGTSPAINAGDNAGCPAIDQRGIARPQALICDIGAYEALPPRLRLTQAAKRKVRAGRRLTFKLKLTNPGETAARNVRLTDRFPGTVRKLKGQKGGCKVRKTKRKNGKRRKRLLSCRINALAPGVTRKIKVQVRPLKAGKRLRNTARVRADGGLGDRATRVVRVTGRKRKP